jgi:hypothetical protein
MIEDYFGFLIKIAKKNPLVKKFRLIREMTGVKKGYIRFVIELRDNSELHVFEYVDSTLHKLDYSYHWQDKEKKLIARWDNAPHHSNIETFPHHLHAGDDIKPSEEPTFVEILERLEVGGRSC